MVIFILSFSSGERPFSNRKPKPEYFFYELLTFKHFSFLSYFFQRSTHVKLSKTNSKTKRKFFKLLQCGTKMNILLNSKFKPNYLLSFPPILET